MKAVKVIKASIGFAVFAVVVAGFIVGATYVAAAAAHVIVNAASDGWRSIK